MKAQADQERRARSAVATRRLIAWAADAVDGELPDAVSARAAMILADDIAAMAVAMAEPQVVANTKRLTDAAGRGEASVFAPDVGRLDRTSAALANGMAATWCELDEGLRSVPCHAGAYVLPALLAEGEARGLNVGQVLSRLAVAYEVTARIASAFPFASMRVHPHAAFATIGAACGAGLARGLDAERLLAALTGAASMTFAGPYAHAVDGALVRNAWISAGAWIGMQSVEWALQGIGGIAEGLHDVFVDCLGADCEPDAMVRGLGESWVVSDGYHKIFACCQYAHSAIEANIELTARLEASGGSVADIRAIRVETHPRGETLTTVEPETVLAAKFSMPHAVAASALLGTGGQDAFAAPTLDDPRIAELRRNVSLLPHPDVRPWPLDRPARVEWLLADGRTMAAECASARGGADRPIDRDTLLSKIESNSATVPGLPGLLLAIARREVAMDWPWPDLLDEHLQES